MAPTATPDVLSNIDILLVEDRPSLRRVVRVLIESNPRFKVVAEAGSPDEAVIAAVRTKPRLAIVDLALGQPTNGLELIERLKHQQPDLPILVLSMHSAEMHAPHAMRAGALGYVMKDRATEQLHDAMETVLRGKSWPPVAPAGNGPG